jgi:hypothetical protein
MDRVRALATTLAIALALTLPPAVALTAAAGPAVPDLSGRWLPVPALATPWPDPLPLTSAARQQLAAFSPDRDEPAGFCMPLGTPRNTLSSNGPLEVLQTADRIYLVFQPNLLNAETRRVYLDPARPQTQGEPLPTWLGRSRGHWEHGTLAIETVDLEPQTLLDGKGLGHSAKLVVRERWHLARNPHRGKLLVDELQLTDPERFTQPIRFRRVFAWAPDAPMPDGQCSERLWIDTLWRHRLAEHAAAARAAARRTP